MRYNGSEFTFLDTKVPAKFGITTEASVLPNLVFYHVLCYTFGSWPIWFRLYSTSPDLETPVHLETQRHNSAIF